MKTNILNEIRLAQGEIQKTHSIRAEASKQATKAQQQEEAARRKLRHFLLTLPKAVGFTNAGALILALKEVNQGTSQQALKKRKASPRADTKNTRLTPEILTDVSTLASKNLTDIQIAGKLGLKPATVKYARKTLGIKGIPGNPNTRKPIAIIIPKAPKAKKPKAKKPKAKKKPKPNANSGKNTRITTEILADVKILAKKHMTDTQIAGKLGLKETTVKYARKTLGIKGIPGNPKTRKRIPAPVGV